MSKKWIDEALYALEDNEGYKQSFLSNKDIAKQNSHFQDIEIFENNKFGKVLVLDGVIQTTESDEFFYHEMFVHVPLYSHGNAKKVLIIGGGDGGILREVLRHNSVEKAIMIEIDGDVVDLCKKHLPNLSSGAFENKRAEVKIADGIDFVKTTKEKFDVIIVDSTDPMNVGEVLFTDEFYDNAKRCLNDGGILSTQSGVPFFQKEELLNVKTRLSKAFKNVNFYVVPVPTYIGSFMCLSFASDDYSYFNLSKDIIKKRVENSQIDNFKYYNEDIHQASFALPQYIKKILNSV